MRVPPVPIVGDLLTLPPEFTVEVQVYYRLASCGSLSRFLASTRSGVTKDAQLRPSEISDGTTGSNIS